MYRPNYNFFSILAWPGMVVRKRLKAILIAIPLMILLAAVDYPVTFIADIESVWTDTPILKFTKTIKQIKNVCVVVVFCMTK